MIEEDKIKSVIKSNSIKEAELLIKIFESLDLKILNEIDKNLEKLKIKNEDFFAQKKQIILSESKKINIYDNFIIVEKSIIDLFNNNFLINKDNNNIKSFKHISGNKKNILLIGSDSHSYLLFGSIINDENIYKLEYIFDFNNEQNLKKQLDELIKDYNCYFDKIIIFNKNNKYDYISPIYIPPNKNEIGNCYKYDNNLLDKDYSNYILNQDLIKMINLYIYYKSLNSRFQNNNKSKGKKEISSEKYYLVNEEIIKKWKISYNYDKINEELNSNSENLKIIDKIINDNKMEQKQIILISKNLNGNINLELNKKNKNEKNNEKDNENTGNENIIVELNFTQIKYFDNSQQIKSLYIYDNFEIISKNIIKNLFNIENVGKNFNLG